MAIALSLFAARLHAQSEVAYVTNTGDGTVSGYTINPSTGVLTPIAGSPFTAGSIPIFVAVHPSGKFAYVANTGDGTVSGYTIDPSTGALAGITGSPFLTGGSAPISVAVDPSGKFAYVVNAGSNNVSGYTIDPSTGALTAINGSPFLTGGDVSLSVAVDPSGKFAYVTNSSDILASRNTVSGYTIDPSTGALTPIAGSPFPAGIIPSSVAVDPSGKFAYVANSSDGTVSGYTIDPSTGALTGITGSAFTAGLDSASVVVDPSGKFAYVANEAGTSSTGTGNTGNVSGYTINPMTGALTPITGSPFGFGAVTFPSSVAVDPSGKFAYVTNFNSAPSTVSGFTINPMTGALTPITGSPFTAGFGPSSVAISTLRLVPFASSFAKLEIAKDSFDLKESFTLGANSKGINPVTENVTLQIGTSSVTIPPGLFKKNPNGRFAFQGVINGVNLQVQIVPLGNNIFTFNAAGTGVNLTGLTNPVTVVLTIGIDSGTTAVNAQFQ